ncbi:EAL domain-containing protein [Actinotalea sp. M2MS4P-6]|uniref:putative bifunctional diguanylate cyclase/phosphodiesterase n=1 Tax=Actinotalea sp. M2MS4P-6 TaxID=2983762 RepID=UPI0021E42D81|nr:EAL domain-containing protein [Actinotalea sp. M2MS4P-6]MCV2393616.1 EAL domain-containing protein [Actinotalea sp. M2MS4P-6]
MSRDEQRGEASGPDAPDADLVLDEVEQKYRQVFDGAAIGMALVAVGPEPAPGTLLDVNRAMCEMLGRSADQLVGMPADTITHPDDVAVGAVAAERVRSGELDRGVVEKRYLRADGAEVWVRVTMSAIHGPDGDPLHLVAQVEDITARKDAENELIYRAMHDPLTGMPNRSHAMEHLERALARASRAGGLVGVLYLDLDDFKEINDSLGHAAGDELLVAVGQRVRSVLRAGDLAARLGGDEIAVVCDGLTTPGEVAPIAQRVINTLSAPIEIADRVLHVSASIGAATGGVGATADGLVREADAAMYRAKGAGKGRYIVGDESLAALAARQLEVEETLRGALEDDGLRLVYQPIVDLGSGRVVAVEALLRMVHPERGELVPAEFVDVAESRGLIVPIGRWVVEEAVRQAAQWHAALGDRAPQVWVNASDRQLGRHDLAGVVSDALAAHGLPADLLGIEIAERRLVRLDHFERDDLAAIRELGVGIGIDDFGTGRSGLDYLRDLPVTDLKVDDSLTARLGTDTASTAIAESLVTLGHGLGLTVTVEGVETAAQLGWLRGWACDRAQGYLLGRPHGADEVGAVLTEPDGPVAQD